MPANLGGGSQTDQIADFEPEPPNQTHYGYRLNGDLVQPYWSAQDNRWLVPDGQSQTLYLNPIWTGNPTSPSFSGKYTLDVHGDQWGQGYNDTIVLDATAGGGVQIILDGEFFTFDPSTITAINVDTYGGSNTVNVRNVPAGVTVDIQGGGSDTVNIGSGGSVQGIRGTVYIENQPAETAINIDDSTDSFARTTTLGTYTPSGDSDWGYITGLSPYANINYEYADTTSVTINTGTASGNVVNVWESSVVTNLIGHGRSTINIGDGLVGARSILRDVHIQGSGFDTLNVNDQSDTAANFAWFLTSHSISNSFLFSGDLGAIDYAGMAQVTFNGGSGAVTYHVEGTTAATTLNAGAGTDTIDVSPVDHEPRRPRRCPHGPRRRQGSADRERPE